MKQEKNKKIIIKKSTSTNKEAGTSQPSKQTVCIN